MNPSIPFFGLEAMVPLLERVPVAEAGGVGEASVDGSEGTDSEGSAAKWESSSGAETGTDKRLEEAAMWDCWSGNMSFKVAVLAREGRGGGDVIPD